MQLGCIAHVLLAPLVEPLVLDELVAQGGVAQRTGRPGLLLLSTALSGLLGENGRVGDGHGESPFSS